MTLSTATPAATTDGEMRRASDMATKLRAVERENKNQQSYNLLKPICANKLKKQRGGGFIQLTSTNVATHKSSCYFPVIRTE